ncbi:MAG: 2-oxoacid:acceptor oxidoreductase family protein [Thermodesulfobacteriota bacterium]
MNGRAVRGGDVRQQILVSGVGGQGVLFVSRLLAEAAICRGMSVLTSEIHGMAQRGGTVVSHVKVGGFPGPLIREGKADGIVVLREENLPAHRRFLSPSGWAAVNSTAPGAAPPDPRVLFVDAGGIAVKAGMPKGINLVLIGYLLARLDSAGEGGRIFCEPEDIREALGARFARNPRVLEESLAAFALGIRHGRE